VDTKFQGKVKIVCGATSVKRMRVWAVSGVALAGGAGTSIDISEGRIAWPTGETGCSLTILRPNDPGDGGSSRSFICPNLCEGRESRAKSREGRFALHLPAVSDALSLGTAPHGPDECRDGGG